MGMRPILDFGFWILDWGAENSSLIQNQKSRIQNRSSGWHVDLDLLFLKPLLDPLQQLTLDFPALLRQRAEGEPQAIGRVTQRIDTEQHGIAQDQRAERCVLAQLAGQLEKVLLNALHRLFSGNVQVEDSLRPAVGEVRDQIDLPVRDEMDGAFQVAEDGEAKRDLLDLAGDRPDLDHIANHVLLLEQHQKTGEVVLNQALSAERHGEADDGDAPHQWPDRYTDQLQNHDQGHRDHGRAQGVVQHAN